MAKYVKKPIVIEAFQWTGTDSLADQPEWLVNAMIKGIARVEDTDRKLRIHTREGIMTADIGDYIIRTGLSLIRNFENNVKR